MKVCPSCGCSHLDPCRVFGVPCTWIRVDGSMREICSACAPIEELADCPNGRRWIRQVALGAALHNEEPFEPCQAQQRWETTDPETYLEPPPAAKKGLVHTN